MAHQLFRLLHHLALGDPQGGLGHGDGEVVDLDAVELANGDPDGVGHLAQDDLAVQQGVNDFVLQAPQGEVGLRQKIPRAAGGVYVPTDFDTKEKALSGAKAAEKGLK